MKTLAAILLLIVAVATFAAPDKGKVTEVSLERGYCFGPCRVYQVTLRSDGTLTYRGEANVERKGVYEATFYQPYFVRLTSMIGKLGFWKMKGEYLSPMTDQAHNSVAVKRDGRVKEVEESGPEPDELWAIESLIDSVVANARNWEKKGELDDGEAKNASALSSPPRHSRRPMGL